MIDYLLHKKFSLPVAIGLIVMVVLSVIWMTVIRTPAYWVCVDGEKKFVVKCRTQVEETLQSIQKQQEKQFHQKLELGNQVDYKRTFASRDQMVSDSEIKQQILKTLNFQTMAGVLSVNGKAVAYLENKPAAEKLLTRLKKEYTLVDEGEKLVSCSFAEKVAVQEKKVPANRIMSAQKAYELITTGTDQPQKYEVQEGDNLWLIARRNDMYVDDIMKANQLQSEDLQIGDELILVKSQPYINVVAMVEGEKVEAIPFETKTELNRSVSGVRIKQEGKNGEKKVVYVATKVNGVVDKRQVKEETILKEAVTRVLVKGSTTVTVASRGGGTGVLDWPAYGPLSKYYGRGHTGLDIAARNGSPIRAADSGTVTFTGWQGGYGNFIIVNHGNGMITRYAHCSSISVSKGQQVARGEAIGAIGSTGRSSGPHVHFEVLTGGSFNNPLSYLR